MCVSVYLITVKNSVGKLDTVLKCKNTAPTEINMVEASFLEFLREGLILNRNMCTIKYLAHILCHSTLTAGSQR